MSNRQARTAQRVEARRASREQGPPSCRCTRRDGLGPGRMLIPSGPTMVATFRKGDLVELVRRHHCGRPAEHVDLTAWSRR